MFLQNILIFPDDIHGFQGLVWKYGFLVHRAVLVQVGLAFLDVLEIVAEGCSVLAVLICRIEALMQLFVVHRHFLLFEF
jgi:hypothetical protein